ncbi:hypothetical protein I8X65_00000075 [Escherichia coli]
MQVKLVEIIADAEPAPAPKEDALTVVGDWLRMRVKTTYFEHAGAR